MIDAIGLENIRVFKSRMSDFPLADLSVFCGTNNSGKSSVLKSLLLLRQSQGVNEPTEVRDGTLRFVGTQVDLGNYSTFVSDRDVKKDISLRVTCDLQFRESPKAIAFLRSLQSNPAPPSPNETSRKSRPRCKLDSVFTFTGAESAQGPFAPATGTEDGFRRRSRIVGRLKRSDFTVTREGEKLLEWSVTRSHDTDPEDLPYALHMPKRYFEAVGGPNLMDLDEMSKGDFAVAPVYLYGLLPAGIFARAHTEKEAGPGAQWSSFRLTAAH